MFKILYPETPLEFTITFFTFCWQQVRIPKPYIENKTFNKTIKKEFSVQTNSCGGNLCESKCHHLSFSAYKQNLLQFFFLSTFHNMLNVRSADLPLTLYHLLWWDKTTLFQICLCVCVSSFACWPKSLNILSENLKPYLKLFSPCKHSLKINPNLLEWPHFLVLSLFCWGFSTPAKQVSSVTMKLAYWKDTYF